MQCLSNGIKNELKSLFNVKDDLVFYNKRCHMESTIFYMLETFSEMDELLEYAIHEKVMNIKADIKIYERMVDGKWSTVIVNKIGARFICTGNKKIFVSKSEFRYEEIGKSVNSHLITCIYL